MTEEEWMVSTHPTPMLEFVEGKVSDRRLRLFACACCRHESIWRLLNEQSRELVEAAENYADSSKGWEFVVGAARLAPRGRQFRGRAYKPLRLFPPSQAERAVLALAMDDAWESAWGVIQQGLNLLGSTACDLLRELIGHPTYYSSDVYWSQAVLQLTAALRDGQDCGFVLHDALLESGHPLVAAHFREEPHPKNCWARDLLFGKD